MSTQENHPFSEDQRSFLADLLSQLEQYVQGVETVVNDLGRDFTALKEILEEKSVITADEFVVHLEKAIEDLQAAEIAQQNRKFFDELRKKLGGDSA